MSEYDAIDAMVERMVREEQDEIDRAAGQFILDAIDDQRQRRGTAEHPLLEAINRAHLAKIEADKE